MRRSSFTWLFSGWLALAGARASAAAGGPWLCVPPVFDGGQRLHSVPISVYWLEPLLRQHELCWWSPHRPGELRVVLVGNSSVFGFPLPVEQTFAHLLNQDFATEDVPAHVFNLAWVNTYQLKDAVIIHDALPYQPDVILYPITLAEMQHAAPIIFPSVIQFFDSNASPLAALAAHPPPGLAEPLALYRPVLESRRPVQWSFARLQEGGTFLRTAVQGHAQSVGRRLGAVQPTPPVWTAGRQTTYDCSRTQADFDWQFRGWQSWNVLAYLEQIRSTRGVAAVVVNWPVAHEPVGDCYNVRYPAAAFAEYNAWLRAETAARGLHYVDLHDLLPADFFLDSLHVSAAGHRQIAEQLSRALAPLLAEIFARHARLAAEPGPAVAR